MVNRIRALLEAAANERDGYVPFEEVYYRYITLLQEGLAPSVAFELAYRRALEFVQAPKERVG